MQGMVDIHCHIVCGVDDGARKMEDTQRMLRKAWEQGVRQVICTSHATPGEEPFPMKTYSENLAQAQAWCDSEGMDMRLYPGCEILYTRMTERLLKEGHFPALADSRYVLVEFDHADVSFDTVMEAVRTIGNAGYSVMIAHIERFRCLRSVKRLQLLRDQYNVRMQMNAATIIEKHGFFERKWFKDVLELDLIDVIGSDAHNDTSRPCEMGMAFAYIRDHFDEEYANDLCGGNARKILQLA